LDHVVEAGKTLKAGLDDLVGKYPAMAVEARGVGLMLGIKIKEPLTNGALGDAAREEGLLTVVAGDNVLRLVPPLIVGEREIPEALAALDRAFAKLANGHHD